MQKSLNVHPLVVRAALVLFLAGTCLSQSLCASGAGISQSTQQDRPSSARVRTLIDQVEAAYSQGQSNYRRGKLPEAKADFDRAVDLMLSSGIDIKSDDALQDEFNKIIDGVNGLEMEALKQGNGFTPNVEPSPADVASEVTFAADPSIKTTAQTQLASIKSDLPLVVNDYVAMYINFFANTQKGHNTLLHSFQRAGRYKAMIERVMGEEGVPQDLIYLAVAESGFQPRALNGKSGAGGMWQFMPHGNYGLDRNTYVDERFDPEKSTRAYARYMKYLYNQLGDWYLAMAAYDWGAGNVQRAVEKTGYADYWELYKRNNLPGETQAYVPEILAAIIIANHPTQYGFDEVTLDPPVLTDTVTVNNSVSLKLVADVVNAPIEVLEGLNPSLLRGVTPPDVAFDLHLPAGTGVLFNQKISLIPEAKRTSWRYRAVKPGDTLASIAESYHVTASDLAVTNQLDENAQLAGIGALAVPVAPTAAPTGRAVFYVARRGDTLVTIADRFGVSLSDLREWNHISGTKVTPGSKLRIATPGNVPVSARRRHSSSSGRNSSSRNEKSSSRSSRSSSGKSAGSSKKSVTSSKSAKGASTKGKSTSGANKKSTQSKGAHKKSARKK